MKINIGTFLCFFYLNFVIMLSEAAEGNYTKGKGYYPQNDTSDKMSFEHDLKISAIKVPHSKYSMAYMMEKDDIKIVYSGDTDYSEDLINFSKNTDILIHECSKIEIDKVKGHVIPSEIAQLSSKIKPHILILTHFYPICDDNLEEIHQKIKKQHAGELVVGKDDDIIAF